MHIPRVLSFEGSTYIVTIDTGWFAVNVTLGLSNFVTGCLYSTVQSAGYCNVKKPAGSLYVFTLVFVATLPILRPKTTPASLYALSLRSCKEGTVLALQYYVYISLE